MSKWCVCTVCDLGVRWCSTSAIASNLLRCMQQIRDDFFIFPWLSRLWITAGLNVVPDQRSWLLLLHRFARVYELIRVFSWSPELIHWVLLVENLSIAEIIWAFVPQQKPPGPGKDTAVPVKGSVGLSSNAVLALFTEAFFFSRFPSVCFTLLPFQF